MKTQLVIMAAGIGSRFGEGIKQLTPLGPNGEIIMDYSISSAIKAGFDEVVIIIRKEIEKDFIDIIGSRLEKKVKCRYAYQELDMLPGNFKAPADRKKPYGTAHAIYCAKDVIDSPFVVINADDYYGDEGFKKIHEHLINHAGACTGQCPACDHRLRMSMAGYKIGNTLSENGTVTRGICKADENGFLTDVVETYEISKKSDGRITGEDDNKNEVVISEDSLVSMNMFGLPYEFVLCLEKKLVEFLEKNNSNIKSEFLLPTVVNEIIKEGNGTVHVLPVSDRWYGVTYASDKEYVRNALKDIKL
ncbi:MAG: NTP transferase domain-containing protein [Lachnospiraceae bacterium]|nr:NTP transferase domain-containing protein [Lachnospiraceae bacterium]